MFLKTALRLWLAFILLCGLAAAGKEHRYLQIDAIPFNLTNPELL